MTTTARRGRPPRLMTDTERTTLIEAGPTVRRSALLEQFAVSSRTLSRWEAELGIQRPKLTARIPCDQLGPTSAHHGSICRSERCRKIRSARSRAWQKAHPKAPAAGDGQNPTSPGIAHPFPVKQG